MRAMQWFWEFLRFGCSVRLWVYTAHCTMTEWYVIVNKMKYAKIHLNEQTQSACYMLIAIIMCMRARAYELGHRSVHSTNFPCAMFLFCCNCGRALLLLFSCDAIHERRDTCVYDDCRRYRLISVSLRMYVCVFATNPEHRWHLSHRSQNLVNDFSSLSSDANDGDNHNKEKYQKNATTFTFAKWKECKPSPTQTQSNPSQASQRTMNASNANVFIFNVVFFYFVLRKLWIASHSHIYK